MLPTQLATENDNNIHWTPDLHSHVRECKSGVQCILLAMFQDLYPNADGMSKFGNASQCKCFLLVSYEEMHFV